MLICLAEDFSYYKVTKTPIPYADENIRERPDGSVEVNPDPSTNNTRPGITSYVGSLWIYKSNSSPRTGASSTCFAEKDPKDAYLRYTDHAYLNLNSTDPGEIPTGDFVSGGAKDVLSGSRTQHSGGFRGYPANIKGDQIMRFDVPFGEMGHRLQDKVHQQIGFMYGGLPGEITSTDAAVAAAERARREEEEKRKKTKEKRTRW